MHLQRELAEPHQSHFKSQAAAGFPHETPVAVEPPPLLVTLLRLAGRNWDEESAFSNQPALSSKKPSLPLLQAAEIQKLTRG